MHHSVSAAWPTVAREHEGVCAWPYLDTVGKVTAGIGTLLDDGTGTPPETYLGLPWTIEGQVASRALRASGWLRVKSRTDLAPRGGFVFRDVTGLRLDDRPIDGLLAAKTLEFWSVLSAQLVDLEEWPADAQLALIDMAYQLGPRFMGPKWPSFTAAAHASDFSGCASNCAVRQASAERNGHRARLFLNAVRVRLLGIDPAILWDQTPPEVDDVTAKVEFRGGWTCSCVATSLPWVELDMLRRGIIRDGIDIFQLGWRGDVSASAGTHDKGGCTDVGQWSPEAILCWREWGWPMQRRDLAGIKTHGHGWPRGCTHLAPAAQAQARDWENGRNGLASHGPVVGMWPVKRWDDALDDRKRIIMAFVDDVADAVLSRRKEIAKEVWRGEYVPNIGFAPGDKEGTTVSGAEALVSIRARLGTTLTGANVEEIAVETRDHLLGDKEIPTWRPDGEGGPWALHSLLRSIRQDTDANAKALATLTELVQKLLPVEPGPPATAREVTAEDSDPSHDYLRENQPTPADEHE